MQRGPEKEHRQKITFMVKKEENFSEWYNTLVRQAEIVDDRYNLKGFIVYRPYGFFMLRTIAKMIEDELERRGHKQVLFPVLIPEDNLTKEEMHVEGFKAQVFWVTHGGDELLQKKLALRPTSETAFYPMYAIWIRSISDLPLKLYQTTTVYRYETKATKPLVRGREFYWIEAHDAFVSEPESIAQTKEDSEVIERTLKETLGIPFIFLKRPRWDKFRGAVDTFAVDVLMPDGKMLQVASTHLLGTNFSKAFDIVYQDKDGQNKFVHQTCFGPGLGRMLAALVSIHGDDRGLVLPFEVAPVQVVIVPIPGPGVLDYAKKVESILRNDGLRVELDNGEDTPGEKFYKWEFKGVPFRIEVGQKEANAESVTLFCRVENMRKELALSDLVSALGVEQLRDLKVLSERAQSFINDRASQALSLDDVRKQLKSGMCLIRVPFCSVDEDGEECAKGLDQLGLQVLGSRGEKPETGSRCIVCRRYANEVAYLATTT